MSWRPRNETTEDLALELSAANRIAKRFDCEVIKLSPMLYQVDWAFFRNDELVAWAEYRNRAKRYETYVLSYAKWMKAISLSQATEKPFFLFVEWTEGIYYYQIKSEAKHPIKKFVNSRGQNGDTEPCIYIPTRLFVKM